MAWFDDEKERRAREQHALTLGSDARVKRAIGEAYAFKSRHIDNPVLPDFLGRGRFADLEDLHHAGMLKHEGLFLGGFEGRPIFVNDDVHLLTYGRTGSGKGRDVIIPNLAHVANKSVVVVDPKDGENAFATAQWRERELGHQVVYVNPWELHGFGTKAINPLQFIIDLAAAGAECNLEARYIACALVPDRKRGEGQEWVEGARELVATIIEYLARFEPERCRLSEVWKFVNGHSKIDMRPRYVTMVERGDEAISLVAGKAIDWIDEAGRQFAGYMGQMSLLNVYRPNSRIARATDTNEFDVELVKDRPMTVYLMLPENMLRGAAPWVSLMLSSMIERIARARGDVGCLFLVDEVSNLPKMDSLLTALKLYRSYGIQAWLFSQGRWELGQQGYSEDDIKVIENNCAVLQMWGIDDKGMLEDLKVWGGQTVAPKMTAQFSGAGNTTFSQSVTPQPRPLLQAEDVRMMGPLEQLIRVPSMPLIKADKKPWFEIDEWRSGLRNPQEMFRTT